MTKSNKKIPEELFYNYAMSGDTGKGQLGSHESMFSIEFINKKIQQIRHVLKEKGKKIQSYNGKGLFSLCLPENFNYISKTDVSKEEPYVKIFQGVMYEGILTKKVLGSSHNSIIQVLFKEYSASVALNFIDNVQFIAGAWMEDYGFSVGIDDCIATKTSEIQEIVNKSFVEAKRIDQTIQHPRIKEARINNALSRAKDTGMRIAKDALRQDNGFVSTVLSGSKGDFFNIAQITGLVGQQNIMGQRLQPIFNQGRRTLPHYPFTDLTVDQEFESRGFIRNSFIHGLTPQEFFFHAMSGREGISDKTCCVRKRYYR